jgi:hypothetical protein
MLAKDGWHGTRRDSRRGRVFTTAGRVISSLSAATIAPFDFFAALGRSGQDPLFTTDESRRVFESALERVRCGFMLQVCGTWSCRSMLHLLLSERQKDTSGTQSPTQAKRRLACATAPSTRWGYAVLARITASGGLYAPICSSIARRSQLSQPSTIFPFTIRAIDVPVILTCLPVAGTPKPFPL